MIDLILSLRGGIGVGSLDATGDAVVRFFMEGRVLPERTKVGLKER